jgi:hypothetical protein
MPKADTIAACASAVGAIASAFVAVYALSLAQHQEDIARDQLQATYLSNLYSKQVDSLAALQASLFDMMYKFSAHGIPCGGSENPTKFVAEQESELPNYIAAFINVTEKASAVMSISPETIARDASRLVSTVSLIIIRGLP